MVNVEIKTEECLTHSLCSGQIVFITIEKINMKFVLFVEKIKRY